MLMKKIFTLFLLLTAFVVARAADNYVFVDKDGNVIEDGATIIRSNAVEDDFGDIIVASDLFVKNLDATASNSAVTVKAQVLQIDNGTVQLCFPVNCHQLSMVGTLGTADKKHLNKGATQNLQTEWFPLSYGECVVKYTATSYQGVFEKSSRTVTVRYVYKDSTTAKEDVNGDGTVDALDIQAVINAAANGNDVKFDVNGDGSVDALDIQTVIKVAAAV